MLYKNETGFVHPLALLVLVILLFVFILGIFSFRVLISNLLFGKTDIFAASGNIYYVSSSGSDSNSGLSQTSPWQTINKVNSVTYSPGDQILFQGGQIFAGKIYINPKDNGTATSPITFSSYGTGKATIQSGSDSGIYSYDSQGILILNLNIVGTGSGSNTADGIAFYNDLPGGVKLDHIYIDNIDVSGYGKNGITIGAWNGDSGYSNVKITNTSAHDNLTGGIFTYGQNANVNQNVYVGFSKAFNNLGSQAITSTSSGNGILLGSVNGGVVEQSIAYNNGINCTSNSGPVGIWTYNSNNVTLQYNESYQNHTGGSADGDGFDLDQNVSNSIMQYNYSHDNDGAGFLIAQPLANNLNNHNTVRYNISQNDTRKLTGAGSILVWGTTVSSDVYNNTIYLSPSSGGLSQAIMVANWGITSNYVSGLHFRNNILYTTGNVPLVTITPQQLSGSTDLLFQGNDYYSGSGNFKIVWGNSSFSDLGGFRSGANQEKVNGVNSGFSLNPNLNNPGNGGTISDTSQLSTLTNYLLLASSPLIDQGLNLNNLFGLVVGKNDYYGNSIPQGSQFDVGANEYVPTITPSPTLISTPTPSISPTPTPVSSYVLEAESMSLPNSGVVQIFSDPTASGGKALVFYSNAIANGQLIVLSPTTKILVTAEGDQCKGAPWMVVRVNGIRVISSPVLNTVWSSYSASLNLAAATYNISVSYINDYSKGACDRNLRVDKITIY